MSLLESISDAALLFTMHAGRKLMEVFLSPASAHSIYSLLFATMVAGLWLARRHIRAGLPIRVTALQRLLFPRRWLSSPSARLDVRMFLFNIFVFGVILAGAISSHQAVSAFAKTLLVATFGDPAAEAALPEFATTAILTVALFLAYELAFWVYHYLCHTIPALWELHKVHHSATVLTPLTNSRIHPLEGWLVLNLMALFMGVTDGAVTYLLGGATHPFTIAGSNAVVVIATYLIAHLHHTHVWIAFTGIWGRIFISPAHHQIHHSTNPIHFNKNMGSVLAIWDWMFGTLFLPSRRRERLAFGIGDGEVAKHNVADELMRPARALAALLRRVEAAPKNKPDATPHPLP